MCTMDITRDMMLEFARLRFEQLMAMEEADAHDDVANSDSDAIGEAVPAEMQNVHIDGHDPDKPLCPVSNDELYEEREDALQDSALKPRDHYNQMHKNVPDIMDAPPGPEYTELEDS